ncbi:hypothetical protein F2Q69_00042506 [Brassica cretica]|uniref:Protein kinase domain-containing protein n=1 Tax=Brassica cretica TaxID=69181 RepID=A0A8S9NNP0_BRACR|nr:hypothetical protein F2Q69_00042506 [Brassica cretica]
MLNLYVGLLLGVSSPIHCVLYVTGLSGSSPLTAFSTPWTHAIHDYSFNTSHLSSRRYRAFFIHRGGVTAQLLSFWESKNVKSYGELMATAQFLNEEKTWSSLFRFMEAIVDQPPPTLPSECFSFELSSFIYTCLQKDSNSQISAKELMEHPFLKKYDDNSGINMVSYFVDAWSLLPTLKNISDSTDSTYTTDSTPFILDVWTYSCLRMSLRVPACPGRVPLSSIRRPPAPTWLSELQHVGPSWHCPPPGYNSQNYATTRH